MIWVGVVMEAGIALVFGFHEWRWRAFLPWLMKLTLAFEVGPAWPFIRVTLGTVAIGAFLWNQHAVRARA